MPGKLIVINTNRIWEQRYEDSRPNFTHSYNGSNMLCKVQELLCLQSSKRIEYANISTRYQCTVHFELTKFDCVLGLNYF